MNAGDLDVQPKAKTKEVLFMEMIVEKETTKAIVDSLASHFFISMKEQRDWASSQMMEGTPSKQLTQ